MTEKPRYRRLRVSLRALMLLVLATGGWLGMQVDRARHQRELVDAIRKHGGWVDYDYEYVNGLKVADRQPWGPRWLRRRLGDEYFQQIEGVTLIHTSAAEALDYDACDDVLSRLSSQDGLKMLDVMEGPMTDKGLAHLAGLTQLEELYFGVGTDITDGGLESIRRLVNLRRLYVDDSKVTDRGLLALAGMTKMNVLVFRFNAFSDRGFSAVAGMRELKWLELGGSKERPSQISDASLSLVAGMNKLEDLSLSHSRVTDKGLAHLRGLTKLQVLSLEGCSVGDEGMKHFSGLNNLKQLNLNKSSVGDEGLKYVKNLPKLSLLHLHGSKVSEKARLELKGDRPSLSLDGDE